MGPVAKGTLLVRAIAGTEIHLSRQEGPFRVNLKARRLLTQVLAIAKVIEDYPKAGMIE